MTADAEHGRACCRELAPLDVSGYPGSGVAARGPVAHARGHVRGTGLPERQASGDTRNALLPHPALTQVTTARAFSWPSPPSGGAAGRNGSSRTARKARSRASARWPTRPARPVEQSSACPLAAVGPRAAPAGSRRSSLPPIGPSTGPRRAGPEEGLLPTAQRPRTLTAVNGQPASIQRPPRNSRSALRHYSRTLLFYRL